ncbi:MAG: hypothetical protein ACRCYU_17670 [Nocardioides sp.]
MTTRWNYFTRTTSQRHTLNPENASVCRRDADSSSKEAWSFRVDGTWQPVDYLYLYPRSDDIITYISTTQAIEMVQAKVASGHFQPPVDPIGPNPDPTAPDPDLRDPKRHDLSTWTGVPINQQPRWQYHYMIFVFSDGSSLRPDGPRTAYYRQDPDNPDAMTESLDKLDGRWYRTRFSYLISSDVRPRSEYTPITAQEATDLIQQAVDAGLMHPLAEPITPAH